MTNTHSTIDGLTLPESVYLGLGSNLGDRESNLREAQTRIESLGLAITRASSIYETEPVGYANQPWFLNQVIEARVDLELTSVLELWSAESSGQSGARLEDVAAGLRSLSHKEPGTVATFWILGLLEKLLEIELEMGRERTIPNGPRAIDMDILIFGDVQGSFGVTRSDPVRPGTAVAAPPFLSLPHPRMHERRFVLEPLCEIARNLVHPALLKTCGELLESLEDTSSVRLYNKS